MATKYYTGVLGTATITGTGSYVTISNVSGYRPWSSVTDGDTVEAAIKAANGTFENVLLTKSGGSTPVLARTTILDQTDGSTNPVSWPTNTAVEIYSTAGGKTIANLRAENQWLANQHMEGARLSFDDSQTTYFQSSTNNEVQMTVGGTSFARFWLESSKPTFRMNWSDSGAGAGPDVDLYRNSSSPAAADLMGRVRFLGKNSVDSVKVYGELASYIIDPNSTTEDGGLYFRVIKAGSVVDQTYFEGDRTLVHPTNSSGVLMVGKLGSGFSTNGVELYATGEANFTGSGITPVAINRKSSDGKLITFFRDGTEQGSIGVASGVVSLTGASLSHPSEWADGRDDPNDMQGLVVCTAEGTLDDESGIHALVRISYRERDPTVYGVVQNRDGELHIGAVGVGLIRVIGSVRRGDLLETSEVPGCARAQGDDVVRSSTVAKATQSSPDSGGWRLVPCTLMAG